MRGNMNIDTDDRLEANKAAVTEFYDMAFNRRRPEQAAAKFLGSYYRQHNPGAGDGPEPFIAFVRGFAKAYPSMQIDFKRTVAEGDLVVIHSHLVRQPGDRGMAVMDIFRLEGGKIVEHWDVLQEVPEKAENTNTMF
jgi:predicted SnoaL-like aldol condensation-catalyzing enzyme